MCKAQMSPGVGKFVCQCCPSLLEYSSVNICGQKILLKVSEIRQGLSSCTQDIFF